MTYVASKIEAVEVRAQEGSRLGRYLEIRQGTQSLSVEVEALPALVAALCEASGAAISFEIGDRRIVAPGPLALPPGEYRLLVVSAET